MPKPSSNARRAVLRRDISLPPAAWFARQGALWAMLWAMAMIFGGLWLVRAMPVLGKDALIYHLSLPGTWLHEGYLSHVDLPFHDGLAQYSPMLSESISYLLMLLTGDDGLTWLIQPACLFVIFAAFYRSARLLGARPVAAALVTGFLVNFPTFHASVVLVNNDLVLTAGAAIYLYGLLALCHTARTFPRGARGWPLIWSAVGLAVMLATKYVGVVYAAAGLLLMVWPVRSWVRSRGRDARETHGRDAHATDAHATSRMGVPIAVAAIILLAGCGFLIRNALLYGNPMYPSIVKLGGVTIFQGLYDTSAFARHGLSLSAVYDLFVEQDTQFGIRLPTSAVLWAAFLASAVLAIWRRDMRALLACVGFPILAAGLFLAVTPFWREHRLLFPAYYALWLSVAFVAGVIYRRLGKFRLAAVCLATAALAADSFLFWWLLLDLKWIALAALLSALAAMLPWRRTLVKRIAWIALGGVVVLAATTGPWWYPHYHAKRLAMRRVSYEKSYFASGSAWSDIDAMTNQAGCGLTIAYSGTSAIFPLFGPALHNRVVYVPISPADREQATSLSPEPLMRLQLAHHRRRQAADAFWIAGLCRAGVDLLYLAEGTGAGTSRPEQEMIARNPQLFQLVAEYHSQTQRGDEDAPVTVQLYRFRG